MAQILVVDDEVEARRTARRFLEHQGWAVEEAEGGRDAQRLIEDRGEPYDLLVADVLLLGDENGLVLAEEFYRRGWSRKVLFMSGYVDVDLESVAVPRPDKDFVRKLEGLSRLSEAARGLLRDAAGGRASRIWIDRRGRKWTLTFRPEGGFGPQVTVAQDPRRYAGGRIRFETEGGSAFEHAPEELMPLSEYPASQLQDIVDERFYSRESPGG